MIQDIMDFLSQADPEVGASIQKEFDREQHNIELIASENIVSKAVLLAMGTWGQFSPISMRRAILESGITEAAMPWT